MHVEPALDATEVSPAYTDLLKWIAGFLPKEKYDQVTKLITFPLPTVDLTESIFNELSRALEGENGFTRFEFLNDAYDEDFNIYRTDVLKEENFFKNAGFEVIKTAINNLLIIDLPAQQKNDLPEPYMYFLEPELLWDVELTYEGKIDYVIFNEGDLVRYVFDDTYYRKYTRNRREDDWRLVVPVETRHSFYAETGEKISGLGYCPARVFWDIPQSRPELLQRKGPLTAKLGKLDDLFFWDLSTEYFESFGSYPIYWEYMNDEACDYTDGQGAKCEKGYIAGYSESVTGQKAALLDKKPCPKCSKNNYIGPGSVKQIEAPVDNTDADLREPAGLITIDIAALKNAQERLEQKYDKLFVSVVGKGGEPVNDQAKNEKQIESGLTSKENVFLLIKGCVERARKWGLETVAILRYGASFVDSTVIMGDEFYLIDEQELSERYQKDKEAGMPAYHLAESLKTLYHTKYKNNPEMVQRLNILAHLEPYPDQSLKELSEIEAAMPGTINHELYVLKLNFDTYIKRFEAEQLDVLRFGIKMEFNTKIDLITKTLLSYVNTDREKTSAQLDIRRAKQTPEPANGNGNGNVRGEQSGGSSAGTRTASNPRQYANEGI